MRVQGKRRAQGILHMYMCMHMCMCVWTRRAAWVPPLTPPPHVCVEKFTFLTLPLTTYFTLEP